MVSKADRSATTSEPGTPAATLLVLGGLGLRDASGFSIELKARKSRLLLAYLAVPSGVVRTRDQLATLLWNDRQEEQARASLRTALTGIRRVLGEDALIVDQDTVSFRPDCLETDYDFLKSVLTNTHSISSLSEFYGGEFLEGIEYDSEPFTDWVRVLRAECADLALNALEANADQATKNGHYQQAINLLRESVSLEPLKEQTHRAIMRLYAANGERALALAQFRTCKELLIHELDTLPDQETQALADAIALNNPEISQELHQQASLLRRRQALTTVSSEIAVGDVLHNEIENPSIAVLPFVNMSGDAEQNYFAEGITEDIITDLSRVDELSVAAKGSSQIYRGVSISPTQISVELGVRYILEGSVRKSGNSVRISAQLNDTRTNLQIWAERFDRELDNIFQIQSEISQAIVGAMQSNLLETGPRADDNRATVNVEAYQYYMRGQMALQDRAKPNLLLAYDLFKKAIEVDADYSLAYTGIVRSACQLVLHYDVDLEILQEALEHCNSALQIHPDLAEAYSARGFVRILEKKFEIAYDDISTAISLAPDLADAHFRMGQYHLAGLGDIERAVHRYKRAFDLSHDLEAGMFLTMCERGLNRPEEMRLVAQEVLQIAQRRFSLNPLDSYAVFVIATTLNDLGREEDARHWVSIASSFDSEDGAMNYNLACVLSTMGSIEQSLDMLEKTLELGCNETKVNFMKDVDPDLVLVRKDPRFDKLLANYGYGNDTRNRILS